MEISSLSYYTDLVINDSLSISYLPDMYFKNFPHLDIYKEYIASDNGKISREWTGTIMVIETF
jgi:hypothetical protein